MTPMKDPSGKENLTRKPCGLLHHSTSGVSFSVSFVGVYIASHNLHKILI